MAPTTPRGIRNCNPLNIIKSNQKWLGKITPGTDSVFEQFTTMELGVRAACIIIKSYIKKHNCNTVTSIIHRWSPDGHSYENNYIKFVCSKTRWPSSYVIRWDNIAQVSLLLHAMAWFECGQELPMKLFLDGYHLAFK